MNFIYLIITTLTTATLAKGAMECNISETNGSKQCLGAVGEPLIFLLPIGEKKKISLKKNPDVIVDIRGDNTSGVVIHSNYINHSALFSDGTFKLETVTNADSGDYILETNGLTDGKLLYKINIHLEIQVPVSEPVVSQVCLSPEEMKVNCTSDGEGVEFTLTLDGQLLNQTRAGSTDEHNISSVTIILYGHLTGILTCDVHNNVSRKETFINLTSCIAPVSQPVLSQVCLSPEEMTVNCTSEGKGVEFSLTLDSNVLIKTRARSTDEHHIPSVTISLYGHLTGILTCNVQNNVSREETFIHLTSCNGSTSQLGLVALSVTATIACQLLFLVLFLGIKHFNKKKRTNPEPRTVNEDDAEDEIIYSDVRVKKQTRETRPNSSQNAS